MTYSSQRMELEMISVLFRGSDNDVIVCRDRLSPSGALYTVWVVHNRACARKLLAVIESSERSEPFPCLKQIAQNEDLLFVFPYREDRKFSEFAKGQMVTASVGESIAINVVMECLSSGLPWPLLYLVLEQGRIHITKDNSIYFTLDLDLSELDAGKTERNCVSSCARLILDLLAEPAAGSRRSRKKQLKSFELIRKKSMKGAYQMFPELYQDIKLTAIPGVKVPLKQKVKGAWQRNRDWLFRLLLIVCGLLVLIALAMLVTQIIFGEVPWLRLFQNTFDVIGTENLHQGGRL